MKKNCYFSDLAFPMILSYQPKMPVFLFFILSLVFISPIVYLIKVRVLKHFEAFIRSIDQLAFFALELIFTLRAPNEKVVYILYNCKLTTILFFKETRSFYLIEDSFSEFISYLLLSGSAFFKFFYAKVLLLHFSSIIDFTLFDFFSSICSSRAFLIIYYFYFLCFFKIYY